MTKTTGWMTVAAAGAALLMGEGASRGQTPVPVLTPGQQRTVAAPGQKGGNAPETPAVQLPAAPPQAATATAAVTAGTIHGTVKAGNVPLPGVAITATNTLTGKRYATTTDIEGNYSMAIPKTGRYVVRAELSAFAPVTHEVRITDTATDQTAEFALQLASRVAAATQAANAGEAGGTAGAGARGQRAAALGRGTQALGAEATDAGVEDATQNAGNTGTALPSLGLGDQAGFADANDSVAVQGQQGVTNPLAGISEDQLRDRVNDAIQQARLSGGDQNAQINNVVQTLGALLGGGGFGPGGPGGGPGGRGQRGGGGGGGAFRNFNPAQPHGNIFYQGGNNALNSAPWQPDLVPEVNPAGYSNRFGASIAGSPYLPGLTKPDTRQFVFLNLTGQKNLNSFAPTPVRVPTALERAGNFSQTTDNGAPVTLYDPSTGLPIAGDNLANGTLPISPQAMSLLNYYPLCNINCSSTDLSTYNYQTVSNAGNNNVAINARYQRQLGQQTGQGPFGRGGGGGGFRQRGNQNAPPVLRQNINAQFNYSHSASDQRNIFLPLGGATVSNGYSLNLGYTVSYGRLSNNASLNWNRSNGETRNYFTNTSVDPTALAGINVPNQGSHFANPNFYNGVPSIGLTYYADLSNTTPSDTIGQTISFSDFVAWRHKRHNFRFGGDIRRVHSDSVGGNSPLGSFTFTGFATAAPGSQVSATNGSALADFLLGLPQSTSIQAGLYKDYLRENVYDWYATDDWRVLSNVTLNYGIRYEYFGPYTEKDNHLVNLDHNANFTSIATVVPGATGTYGGAYPRSLVNPDHLMYAPRFGGAWSPKFRWTKNVVVRGGYGINYNTGQYATFAKLLSHQAPFAATETNSVTSASKSTLTLQNGFPTPSGVSNNWAVDKNYRLGMVQVYNLNIQKTLGAAYLVNVGYNGSKASNLDAVGSPNATPAGVTTPGVAAFDYEESVAGAHSNSLVLSLQQRQRKGIAWTATYTYLHAIDNASGVGGAVGTPVQNFYRLDLEEGNSSFDQRHNLTGTWLLELPFGPNREFLNKGGFAAKALDGFSLSGNFTFATGTYFTPTYSGNQAEAIGGNTFTLRPDRVFTQPIKGAGKLRGFFNTAAFAAPASGAYGTASQGSIEGPGTTSVSAALSKTVALGGTSSFEARVQATNVFNTVQYSGISTVENSPTFGQVTSAAAMRSLLVVARYRF